MTMTPQAIVPTVLAAALAASAVAACGQSRPPQPYEDAGACPFEGCTYRDWSVLADTQLLAERRDDASVVVRLSRGTTAQALTGVVVTTKVGRALVVREMTIGQLRTAVRPGDSVEVLHHMGEGVFKYRWRGVIDEEFIPNEASCKDNSRLFEHCGIQMSELPEIVWWVKIRTRDGKEGWTREHDHFGNKDRFG